MSYIRKQKCCISVIINIITNKPQQLECIHFKNRLHVKKNSGNSQHICSISWPSEKPLNLPTDKMNKHGNLIILIAVMPETDFLTAPCRQPVPLSTAVTRPTFTWKVLSAYHDWALCASLSFHMGTLRRHLKRDKSD